MFSASAGPSLANLVGGPVGQALFSGLVSIWENTGKAKEEDLATAINRLTQDRTEDLWQKFSDLIGLLWQDPNRPLVILIDDLDRCSPAGAVALLESVRMILANAENLNCRFIVALDRGVLAQAVAKKFADLGHYEGNRYLGKIFPLGFDLPRPNPVEVKDLIERGLEELMLTGGPFSEVLHRALAPAIFANPRLIKRCINRFHLYSRFEENSRKPKADWTDTEIRDAIGFVEWMAATERWPRLRPLLNLRERSYWLEVRTSLSDPMHQPPDSEAEELRRERDLPAWLGGKLASGPEALYEAEKRLRKWGL